MVVNQIIGKKISVKTKLSELLTSTLRQLDGLRAKVEVFQVETKQLRAENAELRQRVEKLERERGVPSEKPNFEWQQVKLGEPAHSSSYKGNR